MVLSRSTALLRQRGHISPSWGRPSWPRHQPRPRTWAPRPGRHICSRPRHSHTHLDIKHFYFTLLCVLSETSQVKIQSNIGSSHPISRRWQRTRLSPLGRASSHDLGGGEGSASVPTTSNQVNLQRIFRWIIIISVSILTMSPLWM